jgi:hypothetical protein
MGIVSGRVQNTLQPLLIAGSNLPLQASRQLDIRHFYIFISKLSKTQRGSSRATCMFGGDAARQFA